MPVYRTFIITIIIILQIGACQTAPLPSGTATSRASIDVFETPSPIMTPSSIPNTPYATIQDCEDSPPIRVIIHERARVTVDTEDQNPLNLRSGPGTSFERLGSIQLGEVMFVIDGPECADGFTWFRVRYQGQVGWVAEGDFQNYYIEPYLSG